jgi:ribosomal protein S6
MSEDKMPVAEAAPVEMSESNHYEFAFHVLPTVAEGEVAGVFDTLKAHITKVGGEVSTEEAPARVDLAYEIVKPIDGKNRKFGSAYFGWVRFTVDSEKVAHLTEELDSTPNILRSIMIKLTRAEEVEPFFYHEAMASDKKIVEVGSEDRDDSSSDDEDSEDGDDDKEAEVSEEELEDSLEKITK